MRHKRRFSLVVELNPMEMSAPVLLELSSPPLSVVSLTAYFEPLDPLLPVDFGLDLAALAAMVLSKEEDCTLLGSVIASRGWMLLPSPRLGKEGSGQDLSL